MSVVINTHSEHEQAVDRISELMGLEDLSEEQCTELNILADAVEAFERVHFPM